MKIYLQIRKLFVELSGQLFVNVFLQSSESLSVQLTPLQRRLQMQLVQLQMRLQGQQVVTFNSSTQAFEVTEKHK